MGQHDPLDGYITCMQLESTARWLESAASGPTLVRAIEDYRAMSEAMDLRTTDPLGLGGLLTDAFRVVQLAGEEALEDGGLLASLLVVALDGLERYAHLGEWRQAAARRLAFRELGLAIGLAASERLQESMGVTRPVGSAAADLTAVLRSYVPLGEAIESFWLDPEHRRTPTWSEHRDINEVMLATRLAPLGYLVLASA
jgi:hypothetical protein